MASILDFLQGSNPEQSRGLLAAAAQILQQSGPSRQPQGLGQILGGGVNAYYGMMDEQRARGQQEQLRGLQIKGAEGDLNAQQAQRDQEQQINAALRNASGDGGFNPDAAYQALERINPLYALDFKRKHGPAPVEYDTTPQTFIGADGKPVLAQLSKTGAPRILDGFSPREKLEFRDGGDGLYGLDQFTGEQRTKVAKGLDPGAILAAQTQRRGQDITARGQTLSDARQREEFTLKQQIGKAPTEFQGKSAAFGLRATEADKILSELKYSPAAINSKASVASWPLVGGALGAATNRFGLTESDQKAEQSQRDFINAVLRQESGAAIADSEFDNARKQYFPQPGDSDGVIEQKARARQLSIQGLQSNAGRAAMTAPAAPNASSQKKSAMKGQVMDGYRFKGGNPADPNAWEKL